MFNYDIFFIITQYLSCKERPKLSFINKKFNKWWKKYAEKYNYIVIYDLIEYSSIITREIVYITNSFSDAIEKYNKKMNKELYLPNDHYTGKFSRAICPIIRHFSIVERENEINDDIKHVFTITIYDKNLG